MSGAMRRIGEYLGLLEDTRYDDYDGDYETTDSTPSVAGRKRMPSRPPPVHPCPTSPSAADPAPAPQEW